ncbi:HEXXH motif domain-containing protein [Actinoplanes sp. NPDC023936]|uniref:HEXXH motif domain-containing protein n=1 Tax=Actinoplanes sp. NPDC023936 TaxID=3154910 RepID=UPI0033D9AD38
MNQTRVDQGSPGPHGFPATHVMSPAMLTRLARGEGHDALTFLINTQRSKNIILARALAIRSAGPVHDALRTVAAHSPATVNRVLTHPSVSNWAMRTVAGNAEPTGLALVALAAALRARCDIRIEVTADDGRLPIPTLGVLDVAAGGAVTVRVEPASAALTVGGERFPLGPDGEIRSPAWHPVDRIALDGWTLTVDDPHTLAPSAQPLIPPESAGLWTERLSAGWEWLRARHPADAADVRAAMRTLFPLSPVASGHVSGTFRHASGCLAISLPTDPQSTAVTFVHELQHLKLSAVMDLFPLVDMSSEVRGYAPWRDDPRPPSGLLHGCYAHIAVARFWRSEAARENDGARRREALVEYTRWRLAIERVCAWLLSSGLLTPIGRHFVTQMTRSMESWASDRIPDDVRAEAAALNDAHHRRATTT